MGLSIYIKMDYEDFRLFRTAKKQSQFSVVQCSAFSKQRYGLVIPVKNRNPGLLTVLDSASSAE